MIRRRRTRQGMTLVEVLVSTTILAMVGAVLWAGFAQTAANKKKFESQADYYQAVRIALERITRELSMAYVSVHLNPNPLQQPMRTIFLGTDRGERDRIDFTSFSHTRLQRDAKESDQNELSYFVARHPDDSSRLVLARREQARIDDEPEKGGRVQILLEDIRAFDLEYLDPQDWEWDRTWDTSQVSQQPNRLPAQVRISITVPEYEDFGTSERRRGSSRDERTFTTVATPALTWALNHASYE